MTTDAPLAEVMRLLDMCVVESPPRSDQPLRLLTPAPDWLAMLLGSFHAAEIPRNAMPFVDHFMAQAEEAWHEGPHASRVSEPFVVPGRDDDVLLRVSAVMADRRRLLVLERLSGKADLRPILQQAREQKLDHEKLARSAAAVHAPAQAIAGVVKALSDIALPPALLAAVSQLSRASADLQTVAASLPAPPSRQRGKPRL